MKGKPMKHLILAGCAVLLLAVLLVSLHTLFDNPFQPSPKEPQPEIHFVDFADLDLTPSGPCKDHQNVMHALLNAPQRYDTREDCSALTVNGLPVTTSNRVQFTALRKMIPELCPMDVLIQPRQAFYHNNFYVVDCIENKCQFKDSSRTKLYVQQTLKYTRSSDDDP